MKRLLFLLLFPFTLGAENRTYDGTDNHASDLGAANTEIYRLVPHAYTTPSSELVGQNRPSPREVSNTVSDQGLLDGNTRNLSDYIWAWGQFIDHDFALTPVNSMDPAPIPIPQYGDPIFNPMELPGLTLPFSRSETTGSDPRQQINAITSFIDASNVYGSDGTTAAALREGVGGRLWTQTINGKEYLPDAATLGVPMANEGPPNADLFAAGDIRANEVSSLTSLHTLMVREHNRVAALIQANPGTFGVDGSDESIYQLARKVVGAQVQAVTYHEYLPTLGIALTPYSGYDAMANPSVANIFASAAFRLGHSQVSPTIQRVNEAGQSVGELNVFQSFFNPALIKSDGIESILRGLTMQAAQETDTRVIDDLRNLLFGPPPMGNDLAAMNIQRGRDHGLPDYNTLRGDLGLSTFMSFDDLPMEEQMRIALEALYPDIDSIDPWVGLLAEQHLEDASVGETLHVILADQFERLRDGDRFWYQNDGEVLSALSLLGFSLDSGMLQRSLAGIVLDNTDIGEMGFDITPESNLFYVSTPEPSTYALLGCFLLLAMRRREQLRVTSRRPSA